jgi:hypothetical protein
VEKPAVIFSEQGFKMFLDFIKETQRDEPKNNPVDKLVQDYFARSDRPDLSAPEDKMEDITQAVSDLLSKDPSRQWTTMDLVESLSELGFTVNGKGMTPTMRGVMCRCDAVVKVAKGTYQWMGESENE